MKNYNQSSNINPVLTNITNNQSATAHGPYFFLTSTNSNTLFNTSFLFRNRKCDIKTTTFINSVLTDKKEVS